MNETVQTTWLRYFSFSYQGSLILELLLRDNKKNLVNGYDKISNYKIHI